MMTTTTASDAPVDGGPRRSATLVWIDQRNAIIVRWRSGEALLEHTESEVPAHHRATGHVRHDPALRHGGGGSSPQSAGEPRRLELLKRFLTEIADRLDGDDDLLAMGPGAAHEHLARQVSADDARHGRVRLIVSRPSPPLTDRQLVARLRSFAGAANRRRTVGAWRWDDRPAHTASGRPQGGPRRVVEKERVRERV